MMVSVEEAKKLLLENTPAPVPVSLPLSDAIGLVLAEDVFAPLDIPPFHQSGMDGYALAFEYLQEGSALRVSHTIQAGTAELPTLQPGQAMRIFTGAPLPQGADTVVMQEKVEVRGAEIFVLDKELQQGSNIRPMGSQTARGTLAAPAGTRLGPGTIGFLAGLGYAEVKVFAAPAVCLVVTGKELVQPGLPLMPGQVYESNSLSLQAALAEALLMPPLLTRVDDEPVQILNAITQGLHSCNLLLITGGISVGDYDFVYEALQKAGAETLFYKIRQKPGKPLYCGRKDTTLVFGLPGNPASVLCCFYQYVVPAIRLMKGMRAAPAPELQLPLAADYYKKAGLTHFMRGKIRGKAVELLQAQESYKMNAYLESDCLIELDEEKTNFSKGEIVRVHPFYQLWL